MALIAHVRIESGGAGPPTEWKAKLAGGVLVANRVGRAGEENVHLSKDGLAVRGLPW